MVGFPLRVQARCSNGNTHRMSKAFNERVKNSVSQQNGKRNAIKGKAKNKVE